MRDLYDRLIEEGETGILRLIEERAQEGLQLDFKQKGRPSHGAFEDNDKKILAKAVSGFANSAGGLIVWGVNAEKVDGVDCAQPPAAPIAHIERFASEAATLVGQLIQPKHDGVHITPIPTSSNDGSGFLLICVERSERRPHRSEAKGQKQYFKRAGDSFFEMEHYDIEDAFSRTATAQIAVRISSAGQMHTSFDEYVFLYQVELINTSDTIAKFPFISFSNGHGMGVHQRHYEVPYKFVPAINGGSLVGGANDVIHPGTHGIAGRLVVLFQRSLDPATHPPGSWRMMSERSPHDSPSIDYLFGCEGMRGETGRWSLDRAHLSPPR